MRLGGLAAGSAHPRAELPVGVHALDRRDERVDVVDVG